MSGEAERVMILGNAPLPYNELVLGALGVVSRFMMCDYGKYC